MYLTLTEADREALKAWAENRSADSAIGDRIPFIHLLSENEARRFRMDLATVLAESEETGEPTDVAEIADILQEYSELAGWAGTPWEDAASDGGEYRIDLSARDEKSVQGASPAVKRVVEELMAGPLRQNPLALASMITQRIKKLPERDVWQVYLPDGYRLRYYVDEPERLVRVVYLGPHSDSRNDGREDAIRQEVHRRRLARNKARRQAAD